MDNPGKPQPCADRCADCGSTDVYATARFATSPIDERVGFCEEHLRKRDESNDTSLAIGSARRILRRR